MKLLHTSLKMYGAFLGLLLINSKRPKLRDKNMSRITATRYHDFSMGHRVVGHENKCAWLHGHNYRITFHCDADGGLDKVGRVIDFSIIKSTLCQWLENTWDHKFLASRDDTVIAKLMQAIDPNNISEEEKLFIDSIVWVDFNPTAEQIAKHLVLEVGPHLLKDSGCTLRKVVVSETRKCSAEFSL